MFATGLQSNFPHIKAWLPHTTNIVSWLYKRAALVLLLVLFGGFVSFGAALVFFLFSNSWGAPLILSRGNELVERTERTIGEMVVRRNDLQSELGKLQLELQKAQQDRNRTLALASALQSGITAELKSRQMLLASYKSTLEDLRQSESEFSSFLSAYDSPGQQAFEQRLIAKRQAAAEALSSADARYRLSTVRSDSRTLQEKITGTETAIEALSAMLARLHNPELGIFGLLGAGPDVITFAERTISALSDLQYTQVLVGGIEERRKMVASSESLLAIGIGHLSNTPLGQAIQNPVHVVFVPYDNAYQFASGTRLYSCRLWIIICRDVGVVRTSVEGEINSHHPLFSGTMRGHLVDAQLTDPRAAREQIIHAGRGPFFL